MISIIISSTYTSTISDYNVSKQKLVHQKQTCTENVKTDIAVYPVRVVANLTFDLKYDVTILFSFMTSFLMTIFTINDFSLNQHVYLAIFTTGVGSQGVCFHLVLYVPSFTFKCQPLFYFLFYGVVLSLNNYHCGIFVLYR